MFKSFLLVALLTLSLHAEYKKCEGEIFFQKGMYQEAYPLYINFFKKHQNANIAYKIGWMYEHGKGISANQEEAKKWYRKSAELNVQIQELDRVDTLETQYHSIDPLDDIATQTLIEYKSGAFGLRTYKPNYIVLSYNSVAPSGPKGANKNLESKFQISLRADYETHWFDFTQIWSAVYTQVSYWQLFSSSSPFREIIYKPELFVTFPLYNRLDSIHMKSFTLGYKHASNGQPDGNFNIREYPNGPFLGSSSRSWNRLFIRGDFQWKAFLAEFTLWYKLPRNIDQDDNPDIEDFYGHGSLKLGYIYKKFLVNLNWRQNFSTMHGAVELEMTYPTPWSNKVFFYAQGFSGYGQSLIDYNHATNQVGFGVSISR